MNRRVKLLRVVWLSIIASLILPVPAGLAQKAVKKPPRQSQKSVQTKAAPRSQLATEEARDIELAVSILSGNWVLKNRTNPDGSRLDTAKGVTSIQLQTFHSNFGSARTASRGLGSIASQETGIHDTRTQICPAPELIGKSYTLESSGSYTVSLLAADDPRLPLNSADEFYVLASSSVRVTGDYPPFDKEGRTANVNTVFRINRVTGTAQLMRPATDPRDLPPNVVVGLLVSGDTMTLNWSQGLLDEYVREK
jgi:hypothetical protein